MAKTDQEAYDELSLYTLQHADPYFIHQNIVDAYAAQHAEENTKPIKITFALVGLYLCLEKGYTGKEVQLAHMQMGKEKKNWPVFIFPKERGEITVHEVLATPAGEERDAAIHVWCKSVWEAWGSSQHKVRELVRLELGV